MPGRGQAQYDGSKWIWRPTRYAIYWRDRVTRGPRAGRLRCAWCDAHGSVADLYAGRMRLSLDHLDPVVTGGTNDPRRLVSSCLACNLFRGAETFEETAMRAERMGRAAKFKRADFARVVMCLARPLDRAMGRKLAAEAPKRIWRRPGELYAIEDASNRVLRPSAPLVVLPDETGDEDEFAFPGPGLGVDDLFRPASFYLGG